MKRWGQKQQIERSYQSAIRKIMHLTEKELKNAKKPQDIVKIIRNITKRNEFNELCETAVNKMATSTQTNVSKDWKSAARRSGKSRLIYQALKKSANKELSEFLKKAKLENIDLIKSIPKDIAEKFVDYIQKQAKKGVRSEDITKSLAEKYQEVSYNKIKTIARTETAKMNSGIIKAQSKSVGIDWYTWKSGNDGRVRKSHRNMNGVLCSYSKPPNPEKLSGEKSYGNYNAGDTYNCRCYAEPVIDNNLISFPRKVCLNGQIVTMSKKQFLNIQNTRGEK